MWVDVHFFVQLLSVSQIDVSLADSRLGMTKQEMRSVKQLSVV